MPRKNSRAANGTGTIRQRSDGRWECRITIGKNPATGKPLRKSFYAPTQGELVKLMKQVQADLDSGTYQEPSKMTVGKWMDIWLVEYLGNIKQHTRASYSGHTKNQIKPDLEFIPLQKLSPHHVQTFYNDLQKTLSPKSIKNIHGVLHGAMAQAVKLGYIKQNPTEICTLPRVVKKEVKVIPDDKVGEFLQVISGHQFETVYYVDLFTGMRQGEILGLTWDSVDFKNGTILISKQLIKEKKYQGEYYLDTTKSDKIRKIKPAPVVMEKLRARKAQQAADQLRAGSAWSNEWSLVFTNELGSHLAHYTVRDAYKRIVKEMGFPDLTFHSLRHSYAVISLMSGDDVKTVQGNLGHHTAAFTLDTYGHVTDKMKEDSANRMQMYIKNIAKA